MARILVFSHRRIVADALSKALGRFGRVRAACEAAGVGGGRFDAALLDPGHPHDDAFALARSLRRRRPGAGILFVAEGVPLAWILRALDLGADGYLGKCARIENVVEAIEAFLSGQRYFSPCAAKVMSMIAAGNGRIPALSDREAGVLRLTAEGRSAKEIARRLGLSARTVDSHRAALMRKTGARSAAALVRFACAERFANAVTRFEPRTP